MSSLDQTIGDTLALVNMVRETFGHAPLSDLPDARPGDTQDCLYYRALKDVGASSVGGSSISFASERQAQVVAELWGVTRTGRNVDAPKSVRHVITQFDRNNTQHYNV